MQAVASRLGVSHAALYRHVGNRDGLVELAIDRAAAQWDWAPLADDWRTCLTVHARQLYDVHDRYPGLDRAIESLGVLPAAAAARQAAVAEHVVALGLPPGLTVTALEFLTLLAADSAARRRRLRPASPGTEQRIEDRLATLSEPVEQAVRHARSQSERAWFDAGVELVLDGVAARLAGTQVRLT